MYSIHISSNANKNTPSRFEILRNSTLLNSPLAKKSQKGISASKTHIPNTPLASTRTAFRKGGQFFDNFKICFKYFS